MRTLPFKLAIAAFINTLVHIGVHAQSDSTELDLTKLSLEQLHNVKIVSASKTLLEAGQAPASVIVVTEEQIRIRGYRSLLDVLMDVPDIKVDDKVYSLNRNRMTFRGIEGQEKIIIMLDGMRISSPTNETIPIMENYPVHLAKQIEIIFGPASALYGADAFSGVINIISKQSEFETSKTQLSSSVGDHGLYNGTLFASKRIRKHVSLTFSGQYFYDQGVDLSKKFSNDTLWDFSSHRTGTFNTIYGPMTPATPVRDKFESPLTAYNVTARLKTKEFEFSFFKNYSANSSAVENNPSNAVYNKEVFYGRGITSISGRHSMDFDRVTITSGMMASQYKINPNSNYRNMYSGLEPAYKYGVGSVVRLEEQVEWRASDRTNLVGGVVLENFFALPESTDLQNPVEESRSIEGVLLNTPSYYRPEGLEAKFYSIKYYNAGAFLQLQQKMLKRSSLTLGLRFDRNSRFGSTFNPRMGVVINASRQTTVKVMAGTAYLAPTPGSSYTYYGTLSTLDSGKTYRSNFMHLPNPNLKPMLSRNLEVSLRQYVGKNFSLTLTGYYTNLTNLLNFGSDDGNTNLYNGKFLGWDVDYIEVFVNEGREVAIGGSLMMAYNHDFENGNIKAYANLSFVDGYESDNRITTEKEEYQLDNISPWMVKSGVDLTWKNFYCSPRLIWVNEQRMEGMYTDESGLDKRQVIDGYSLVNFTAGYKLSKTTVFGNVYNALNQTYRNVGSSMDLSNTNTELFYGNYQDPIRFNIGVRVNF